MPVAWKANEVRAFMRHLNARHPSRVRLPCRVAMPSRVRVQECGTTQGADTKPMRQCIDKGLMQGRGYQGGVASLVSVSLRPRGIIAFNRLDTDTREERPRGIAELNRFAKESQAQKTTNRTKTLIL